MCADGAAHHWHRNPSWFQPASQCPPCANGQLGVMGTAGLVTSCDYLLSLAAGGLCTTQEAVPGDLWPQRLTPPGLLACFPLVH